MPTQHGHGEERSDEAIQPLTKLEAMSLSNGWIATASFAHLATTGFSDSFSPLARKLPLQPGHGAVEGCREIDAIDVGEHEDAPQAVGEFVGEGGVKLLCWAQAFLRHHELHEVADIAHEALREFGAAPGPSGASGLKRRVEFPNLPGTRGQLGQVR